MSQATEHPPTAPPQVAARVLPPLHPQLTAAQLAEPATQQQLAALWQQARCIALSGQRGVQLCLWQLCPAAKPSATLLVVPGRIEAAHKYAELCLDACQSGYQVYLLDHRGQGLSERLCDDRQIGLVDDFDHYADDLALAVNHIAAHHQLPLLAIAHSMGCAVLYRYLQRHPVNPLLRAVCCAPMFGIPLGPLPALVHRLSHLMRWLNRQLSRHPWYVPGQQPYQARPFAGNDLTDCPQRYQWFRDLYQQYPAYQLGGVSWYWLSAALDACQHIQHGQAPAIPLLLVQAGADTVVDNAAQQALANRHSFTLVRIPHARHELLAGTDAQRMMLYQQINQFLTGLDLHE